MNEHLVERFRRQRLAPRPGPSSDESRMNDRANRDIRDYVYVANTPVPEDSKEWLRKSEIPTAEELLATPGEDDGFYANKLHKPWSNRKRYLQTHYELLREDTIAAFREALDKFRNNPEMSDDGQMAIYEKVVHLIYSLSPHSNCLGPHQWLHLLRKRDRCPSPVFN